MITRLVLIILVIGALVLEGNDQADAQKPEYRTFRPDGGDHIPRLCSRRDVAASLRQLLRKHTNEQPNNYGARGTWSFLPTISAGVV